MVIPQVALVRGRWKESRDL